MDKFHCQICGREIKAQKRVIAHHGYQRPGQGWQTASCFGARYAPYEVACNALPLAIDRAECTLDACQDTLDKWLKSPPETIIMYLKRDAWDKRGKPLELKRPENFNRNSYDRYTPRTYCNEYNHHIFSMEQRIRFILEDLKYMRKRLKEWKQRGEFRFNGEWQYLPLDNSK